MLFNQTKGILLFLLFILVINQTFNTQLDIFYTSLNDTAADEGWNYPHLHLQSLGLGNLDE